MLEKLAALVPPPRLNLVRYHGVLAPNAVDRAQIVPGPIAAYAGENESTPTPRRHRLAWAVLLARVFQFELTVCDRCGGKGKIVAAVTDLRSIRTYLEGVGLPARPSTDRPFSPGPIHSKSSTWSTQARPEASTTRQFSPRQLGVRRLVCPLTP